jgi:hypothetical protein
VRAAFVIGLGGGLATYRDAANRQKNEWDCGHKYGIFHGSIAPDRFLTFFILLLLKITYNIYKIFFHVF